jgi:hypothetical protein
MTPLDYANAFELIKWAAVSGIAVVWGICLWVVAGSKQRR